MLFFNSASHGCFFFLAEGRDQQVNFCYVPAHVSVRENEEVDGLAQVAISCPPSIFTLPKETCTNSSVCDMADGRQDWYKHDEVDCNQGCLPVVILPHQRSQSVNQWGHTPRPPYDARSGGPSGRVSMKAPFTSWVPPGKICRLAETTNSVGAPLASSIQGCLLRRQPDEKDQLLGNVSSARAAGVGVDGLCR